MHIKTNIYYYKIFREVYIYIYIYIYRYNIIYAITISMSKIKLYCKFIIYFKNFMILL